MQRLVSQGFSLLLCLALGSPVLAQGRRKASPKAAGISSSSWLRSFGGPSVDCGYSIQPASDGGCVACGYTIPKGADPLTWVVRLSAYGAKLWDKSFTGAVHGSEAYAVCQAPDAGFAVLAPKATNEGGQYRESVRVIRLDQDGQVIWDKTIPGKVAAAHAILAVPDGGFVLGGFANHQVGTSGQSAWVMKLDSQGNSVWERFLKGACAAEKSTALAPGPEGGCLIAYTACASGGGLGVARLDASGQVLWEKAYASTLASRCSDVVKSLAPAPDGGFILSGGTGSVSRNGFLMRLDAQGKKLWDRYLGGGSAYAQPAEDGGVLAVCRRDQDSASRVDLLEVKFDGQGKMLWARDLGEPGVSYDVFSASRGSPRGFFVTGYRMLSSTNTDLCVLRLNEEGSAGKPLRVMDPNPEPGIQEDVFQPR